MRTRPCSPGALPLLAATWLLHCASAASTVEFCVDATLGFVTAVAVDCPQGTAPFRHLGTNLFDIFWDGWNPTPTANISTSLKSLRDAGASGFAVARVFSVPFAYTPSWGWLNESTRDACEAVYDQAYVELKTLLAVFSLCDRLGHRGHPAR